MWAGACGGERLEGSSTGSVVDRALRQTQTPSPSDRTGRLRPVIGGGNGGQGPAEMPGAG
jgi:hypothetical protein